MTDAVNPNGQLGQNAFLQLMMTQMQYQDPLQPQDNSQFLAQLAQFTALEQMTNVAQTDSSILNTLTTLETMSQLNFAHQLIGEQVTVTDANGTSISGTVTGIGIQNSQPTLVINGKSYDLTMLTGVGETADAGS
ncbi:MAG: flagellar hook capping protein [Alicyclobacillus sp.]|nr:flagellar hook capping protein [Alicyclobacillus sp.]